MRSTVTAWTRTSAETSEAPKRWAHLCFPLQADGGSVHTDIANHFQLWFTLLLLLRRCEGHHSGFTHSFYLSGCNCATVPLMEALTFMQSHHECTPTRRARLISPGGNDEGRVQVWSVQKQLLGDVCRRPSTVL